MAISVVETKVAHYSSRTDSVSISPAQPQRPAKIQKPQKWSCVVKPVLSRPYRANVVSICARTSNTMATGGFSHEIEYLHMYIHNTTCWVYSHGRACDAHR